MLLTLALITASLTPYTVETQATCQQTCLAYADEPGYDLKACIARCLANAE